MKTKILLLFIFCVWANFSIAQKDNSITYTPPKYPSGKTEFAKYVLKYISYPRQAVQDKVTGHVEATMYISKEGKVKLVKVSGKVPEFNSQVKRILKLSPNWEPGLKNGVPIDTMINQRVWFSLGTANPYSDTNDISVVLFTEAIKSNVSREEIVKEIEEYRKKSDEAKKLNEEGSALLKEKKFDEALVKFNEAIKVGGNINVFLFNRGLAYLNLKQDDKAKEDFLEAYRKGDEDAGKIYNDLFNK